MPTQFLLLVLQRDLKRYPPLLNWLLLRCLPGLVLVAMSLLLLAAGATQAAIAPPEPGTGQLLLRGDSGTYTPALSQSSRVQLDIAGLVATVTLEQTFVNPGDSWVEGVYAFPLPETAAVRAMEMRVGDRLIRGRIAEKAEARRVYKEARETGRKASLVEQQRPNLFTNRVANIGPGETVTVSLEYVQDVDYREGMFSLRLPTTITARYMPGPLRRSGNADDSEQTTALELPYHGWALPTSAVPDAERISPPLLPPSASYGYPANPIAITVRLDAGMPLASVASPYHDIALSRRAGIYAIELVGGETEMDRDFVLQWQPVTGSTPGAALFTEEVAGQYYGLLMFLPPGAAHQAEPGPRELVMVVDTSGSMDGVSIRQARASVAAALKQLRLQDSFNIIAFSDTHRALFAHSLPATQHNLARASEFVRHLDAGGGTEMLSALRAALVTSAAGQSDEQQPLRQVIFMTDGAVGNEEQLFTEIEANLGRSRLFTVGIGSAPNSWFMRKAADFGRGSYTYVADVNEVGEKMVALFRQLSRPAALQLDVDWPTGVESWPQRLPDLYHGEPLTVAVRFGAELPAGNLRITGELGGKPWAQSLSLPGSADPGSRDTHPGVASIWARRKIASLLDQRYRGESAEAVREAVLPVALAHSLLSPYTSFVAVEERISRPGDRGLHSHPVPNSPPRGQGPQPYAYPATATTAPAKLWLGGLLLFVVILLRVLRQEEHDG